jgi:hypothetical protein
MNWIVSNKLEFPLQMDDANANTAQCSEVSVSPTLAYSWESPDTPDTMQEETYFHWNKAHIFKGQPDDWLELPSDVGYKLK